MAETIRAVARRFQRAKLYFGHGTETAQDEAAWLVGHVLKIAPDKLAGRLNKPVPPAALKKIDALTTARIKTRRPLAYLLKEAWFAGRKFYVDERVIVPRSLTGEFIAEQFQPWIDLKRVRRILDLCTGSGCMAIACAQAFPGRAWTRRTCPGRRWPWHASTSNAIVSAGACGWCAPIFSRR